MATIPDLCSAGYRLRMCAGQVRYQQCWPQPLIQFKACVTFESLFNHFSALIVAANVLSTITQVTGFVTSQGSPLVPTRMSGEKRLFDYLTFNFDAAL